MLIMLQILYLNISMQITFLVVPCFKCLISARKKCLYFYNSVHYVYVVVTGRAGVLIPFGGRACYHDMTPGLFTEHTMMTEDNSKAETVHLQPVGEAGEPFKYGLFTVQISVIVLLASCPRSAISSSTDIVLSLQARRQRLRYV